MARKDLLKGLMEGAGEPDRPARVDAARPRYSTGAIGAVSQSIAELKSRSVAEIEPDLIETAGVRDRLEDHPDEIEALTESIREYGQQVPVLVRPHPDNPERYQIVYGRRRLAALRRLGQPVKAMVRSLDDRELVIAQGQENAARKDLSFVEKAIFAGQMRDAGYERKIICDALHVDKTLISRMLSVADRVPLTLIEAIGAAPGIGRERWLALADLMERGAELDKAVALARIDAPSDKRFEAVMKGLMLAPKAAPSPAPLQAVTDGDGNEIARVSRKNGSVTLILREAKAQGFERWLVEHLEEIHRDWKKHRGE
ncbi:plasmid partitioning protein RepB [Acidimangrovimonas pyrenivorans]|uniref:Plasmid partitioning protein RepB n=1 Tax=Acidimangrovimonas pyrenivorans TaxID=2030798 RepID=A0ABV7AML8_9RHOB